MSKLYNTSSNNASPDLIIYNNFFNKFFSICHFMPLPFLNFLPSFISAIMQAESVILFDLATHIAPLYEITTDSADKKVRRFLQSKENDFIFFYEKFIKYILSNYKIKHNDKNVTIAFDHMHISNKFTVLLFALRIGKVGIPLWFRVFSYNHTDAFQLSLFQEGILFCHNLLKSSDPNCNISFLADRFWGNHTKVMDYIKELSDTYYIRAKGNLLVYDFDKKEEKHSYKHISELRSLTYHSVFYNDIYFTKKKYVTNLAISKSDNHKEPYYIVTNGNPKTAVKEYSKRFSTVEFIFKQEKSNGFFLEETQIVSLESFTSLFTCVCIAHALLIILGIDFSKNNNCYNDIKITTTKKVKGKRKRVFSYFHIGLLIIKYFFKMSNPINLFNRMILYDV